MKPSTVGASGNSELKEPVRSVCVARRRQYSDEAYSEEMMRTSTITPILTTET